MALPHDLRDMELRSYVEVPVAARGAPDNPTAQQVVLIGSGGAAFDTGDGSLTVNQGPAAAITSPWFFALADPVTRVWTTVLPGGLDPTRGAVVVNTEGLKYTYTAVVSGINPAGSATDFVALTGAPTKTVRVTRVEIVGAAGALAQAELLLIKRSSANSAGTPTAITAVVAHDSGNPAPQAVLSSYAANPTLGTAVGTLRQAKYQLVSTTAVAGGAPTPLVWDFGQRNEQCPVLRGVAQQLCLNQNAGATTTLQLYDVAFTWTEE